MKNRERFNANVDNEKEKQFSKRIAEVRKLIKKVSVDLKNTVAVIEPCKYMLIWGSLERCLICIESSISLISQGYIGSANALLRQMYEFCLWSKLGIDSDIDTLKKINAYFYEINTNRSYPVTYVLKHTDIPALNNETDAITLREEGRKLYHNYSSLTHATSIAQQCPFKQDDFYWTLNACLTEICTMLDIFLLVFSQYCAKLLFYFDKTENKDFPLFDLNKEDMVYSFIACNYARDIMPKLLVYHNTLKRTQYVSETLISQAFTLKWKIHGDKLKNIN